MFLTYSRLAKVTLFAVLTASLLLPTLSHGAESALNYFNLGVAHQEQKKFAEAIVNYNTVISLNSPLSPVARFYAAQCYESLGNISRTQALINEINLTTLPTNLKEKVSAYKNRLFAKYPTQQKNLLIQSHTEKRLSIYGDLSYGENSNPDIYTESQSSNIKSDQQTKYRLYADYLLSYSDNYEIRPSLNHTNTLFSNTSSANYSSTEVENLLTYIKVLLLGLKSTQHLVKTIMPAAFLHNTVL